MEISDRPGEKEAEPAFKVMISYSLKPCNFVKPFSCICILCWIANGNFLIIEEIIKQDNFMEQLCSISWLHVHLFVIGANCYYWWNFRRKKKILNTFQESSCKLSSVNMLCGWVAYINIGMIQDHSGISCQLRVYNLIFCKWDSLITVAQFVEYVV